MTPTAGNGGLATSEAKAASARAASGRDPRKTFCEFFAGIGLVREGLEPSGWHCVYANDIDRKKMDAYQARFGRESHFDLGDVWKTESVIARIPGKPSLMTASFPCVDLSLAGHYRGLAGNHSSTFFGFAAVLEALRERRPSLVMLENVTGFLTSRKGQDFATAVQCLANLGYWLDAFVLDAAHFTPQSRQRVFVIGVQAEYVPQEATSAGFFWPPEKVGVLRPPSVVNFKCRLELPTGWITLPIPAPPRRCVELADVIDVDAAQDWWDEREVQRHCEMMSDTHRSKVNVLVASGGRWIGTIFRRVRHAKLRAEVRFDGLAGCLRTPRGGSAKQIVIVADDGRLRMRWMSPREYARLQGVPDFPLVGTNIQQLWGFADAVCVPAIRWIDRQILSPLFDVASIAAADAHG
ncbi:MAG TPA: DNA (cytosine-5-)-methyltransferase [Pirellulales bacterium]